MGPVLFLWELVWGFPIRLTGRWAPGIRVIPWQAFSSQFQDWTWILTFTRQAFISGAISSGPYGFCSLLTLVFWILLPRWGSVFLGIPSGKHILVYQHNLSVWGRTMFCLPRCWRSLSFHVDVLMLSFAVEIAESPCQPHILDSPNNFANPQRPIMSQWVRSNWTGVVLLEASIKGPQA